MPDIQYSNFAIESTYGIRPGTGQKGYAILSENLALDRNYEFVRSVDKARIPTSIVKGRQLVRGSINSYLKLDMELGHWLKALFGKAPTTTNLEPSIRWQHVFQIQDDPTATWPSLSIDVGVMKTTEKRHVGCLVDGLSLDVADGGPLGLTWDIIGRPFTAAAIGSAVVSGSQDYLTHVQLATFQLDAQSYNNRLLSMAMKNNMQDAFEGGSRNLARGEFGPLDITGELGIRYTTQGILDDFLAETPRKLTATFTGGTLGAGNYQLKIEVDHVVLKAAGAHINKQEQVVQTVPFEAKQNGTNPIIQATLIDGISSYA